MRAIRVELYKLNVYGERISPFVGGQVLIIVSDDDGDRKR